MEFDKTYNPSQHETEIYNLWEKSGSFKPINRGNDANFSMIFPLPNANGNLHLGHALTNAIYDIVIRYHRMKGDASLYLPGSDHAGFETQVVYEKELAKNSKSRFDYTREELYSQIWEFVEANKGNFQDQFRSLGASCDWSRYTYTLDKKIVDRAYKTFKKMWDEGLVYRGERLVNYCTFHGTGFADIEVSYKEISGHLWSVKYPLTDGSGEIVVATTRPETMLGDTAVAVNPSDKRYSKFIGKTVKLPLTDREVPIITDDFVDKDFGTGAVKITPAHDVNDFEAGKRHDLPQITIIGHNGKINHNAPEKYQGLSVKEARKSVVEDLKKQGFLTEVEEHLHNVGHCYKCGTVIEPLLLEQWFINMKPLAKKAINALEQNKIKFYPESKKTQLINYLNELQDWNISRQIAWGIPIPAFVNREDDQDWIFDERVEEETIEVNGKTFVRDPDVFDTWFSSSSWPYATLDYPNGDDYKKYYPTSLLDTGGEILYPWVSRMIMLGLYITGDVPFKEVYIHGYVMAEDGAKMSKSLGNVIDPIPVIKKNGADALRMGLVSGRTAGVNRGYDSRRVEEARNFCNKLWNIARYISAQTEKSEHSLADDWIISRLNIAVKNISFSIENYNFSEAYDQLYHFVWDDFADWYIEASKVKLNTEVLNAVFKVILKIAHPFAPFVTEVIWQKMYKDEEKFLITSAWPEQLKFDGASSSDFEKIINIVGEIRSIKASLGIEKGILQYEKFDQSEDKIELIKRLANLKETKEGSGAGIKLLNSKQNYRIILTSQEISGLIDSLNSRLSKTEEQIKAINKRLSNQNYIDNAPEKIVEESRQQRADLEKIKEEIKNQLESLKQI